MPSLVASSHLGVPMLASRAAARAGALDGDFARAVKMCNAHGMDRQRSGLRVADLGRASR